MVGMTHCRTVAAAFLIFGYAITYAAEQKAGIEIGVAPILPVRTLAQNYAPLSNYLKANLHESVTIVSAPDFKTFFQRIRDHEYPIIVTIPNSAYLAWADSNYIPLLWPLNYTRAVIVVTNDRPLLQPVELRGKTVAMPDALVTVSMLGIQMLQEAGLKPGRDVFIKNMQNHSEAVNNVISGEVAAAIVSDRAIMQMPLSIREKIKIAYTWEKGAIPGIVYLGNPDIPHARLDQISKAISRFANDTPEGKKLMEDWGYGGLKSVGPTEMRTLAPYGVLLKKALPQDP